MSVAAFIDRLANAPFIDHDLTDAMRDQRETLLPVLIEAAATGRPATKINANALLIHIGEPQGTAGLLRYITTRNALLCREALRRLHGVFLGKAKMERQRCAVDRPAAFQAIDVLIDRAGPETRLVAVHVLQALDLPEAEARVASLVDDPDPAIASDVASWLASRGEDRGALRTAARLLFDNRTIDHHIYHLIGALENLSKSEDAPTRRKAGRLAARFLQANLTVADNNTANHAWHCLDALAQTGLPEEVEVLRPVAESAMQPWVRVMAMKRLAVLKEVDGIDRLCAALADDGMRRYAAKALAECAQGSTDAMALASLVAALDQVRDEDETAAVVSALTALGDVPDAILERALRSTSWESAMDILWITRKRRPRHLAKRLVALGIIPPPSTAKIEAYETQWKTHRGARKILLNLLGDAGRLTGFLTKGDATLDDQTETLGHLIEITRGSLAQDECVMTAEEDGFRVTFRRDAIEQHFVQRYLGRYFDLRLAIDGLNGFLESVGEQQRLVPLLATGEAAAVAFLPPTFECIRREFFILPEDDADEGIRASVAYTNQVLSLD